MLGDTLFYLGIGLFWITVVVLDLLALFRVRALALSSTAAVLWTVWIIVAPILGAVSSFIVATSPANTADEHRAL